MPKVFAAAAVSAVKKLSEKRRSLVIQYSIHIMDEKIQILRILIFNALILPYKVESYQFKEQKVFWRECCSPKFPPGPKFQRPLHKVNI
jgi:hypothetical protein